jgi:hypothetical protein
VSGNENEPSDHYRRRQFAASVTQLLYVGRGRTVVKRLCAALFVATVMLVSPLIMPVTAANPGTVKIDGVPWDDVQNNEPHPGCVFRLQFFGFPENTDVSYKFAVYPPTSNTNGPRSTCTTGSRLRACRRIRSRDST